LSDPSGSIVPGLAEHRRRDLRQILEHVGRTGEALTPARTFRVRYTLAVKPGAVPRGEVIRAWLPYPQEGHRQSQVRLLTTEPTPYLLSPSPRPALSGVYLEQASQDPQPTVFAVEWTYRAAGFYQPIDPERVRPVVSSAALAPHLAERPPHIVFSDDLLELAEEIVGAETNPYLMARRIFAWVSQNIPWAGAREYSTLDSLAEYALRHRRGDCGIQTLLFMSLCRLNGIPARWESGWITGPDRNLHDWCAIYLEPYGWVPVDVSFGLVTSEDERERWFYLGGTDRYRLVVNTDYSQEVYPLKTFFRSEIVDFQRGEVEWRGGNLYFDLWDYEFQVEEVQP
jgi:transglutaminase-like putative cysteine protease